MNQPKDHEARFAAIHGGTTGSKVSFINAAAGSGKTDTVVLRVIHSALLNDPPIDVRRIGLATFTIAAAGEMKARVRQVIETLIAWCDLEDPQRELANSQYRVVRDLLGTAAQRIDRKELAAKARVTLGNLDAAPWGTLHGLAMTIVENNAPALPYPAALRLEEEQESIETALIQDATFRGIVAEDSAFELISQTVGSQISWETISSQGSSALTEASLEKLLGVVSDNLVGQHGFESGAKSVLEATLTSLALSKEVAWTRAAGAARSFLDNADPETIDGQDASLFTITSDSFNSEILKNAYLELRESNPVQEIGSGDVVGLMARLLVNDESARKEVSVALGSKPMKRGDIERESQSFINGEPLVARKKRNAKGKEVDLSKVEFKKELTGALTKIEEHFVSIAVPTLVAAQLLDTAIKIARQGVNDRRDGGTLRYDDLIDLACVILSNPEGRDMGLDMLVIDEFQDSDPIQHAFLNAAEGLGLKVVTVGDQRQSIYGFRGATPELFANRLAKTLEDSPECVANLDVTFRHNPVLVTALNAVFAAEISHSGVTPPDASAFRSVEPTQSAAGISVHVFPYVGNAAIRRTEAAKAVAQEIRATQQANPEVSLMEFAILTETRNAWREIKAELTNSGIPYLVTAGSAVGDSAGIRGFMAVLRYLATHREIDRVGALLSVWVGGTLKDAALGPLAPQMADGESVGESHAGRLEALRGRVALNGHADTIVLSLIEELNCYALIREIEQTDPSLALDLFADLRFLVDEVTAFTARTGQDFRAFVEAIDSGGEGEKDLNRAKSVDGGELVDAVQLTTIHSAKGLEYTFVFVVPNEKQSNMKPITLWPSLGESHFAGAYINAGYVAPVIVNETSDHFKQRLAYRARASKDRELYVALTRAKDSVSVFIPMCLVKTDDASHAAALWWGKTRKPESAGIPDILADRLHAISQATVESFPVALAQASITIKTIEVSREADLGVDVESQSIGSAVMPTKLELEPALRIITGSRVKKSSSKVEAASETDTSNFAVFLEEEVESTLERKAGAEFGTIVHRCSQILHARAVPLPQVEEEALKIASQLCRGSDISIQAAASAAASINLHALVHEPGVEFEFPVLVSMQGGNHAGPYIGGGVVDIVIFAKDHTEIYDIKTDQVSAEGLSELARKYQGQLTLYASALERVGCPPVTIMGLLTTSVRDAENKATLVPVSRESK